jgi:hypothetical protein
MGIDTYHVVPPSGEKKNQISMAPAAVVLLIVPSEYLNVPPDKVRVKGPPAPFVRIKVKEEALFATTFAPDIVNVQD